MATIKKPVTKKELIEDKPVQSPNPIKLSVIYPKYVEIVNLLKVITNNNLNKAHSPTNTKSVSTSAKSTRYSLNRPVKTIQTEISKETTKVKVTPCTKCCFCTQCQQYSVQNQCPQVVACESDRSNLYNRLTINQNTIHDIVDGLQPLAIISKVTNFQLDSYVFKHIEPVIMDNHSFLTFSSNPYLYLTDSDFITNQINSNVFLQTLIINSVDYHMYFYIYKRLILQELISYGLLDDSSISPSIATTNCTSCEVVNCNSPLCNICKLNRNKSLSSVNLANNFWNYRDLTPLKIGANIYILLKPMDGFENVKNSSNLKVHQVVHYGVFLRQKPEHHAFKIVGTKSHYIRG